MITAFQPDAFQANPLAWQIGLSYAPTIQMVDPRYETPRSWTAKNTPALLAYGGIPILFDDDNWRAWATTVISLPAFAAVNAPRPEHFTDWRDWAWRFNEIALLLPTTALP